jgi:hypothetical protein
MKKWSSIRAVYLLIALVLMSGVILENWYIISFIITMLLFATITKFCPSKWFFEKLGFGKSEI